eukprot:11638824-Ditylum_brightwellii.AAC.1
MESDNNKYNSIYKGNEDENINKPTPHNTFGNLHEEADQIPLHIATLTISGIVNEIHAKVHLLWVVLYACVELHQIICLPTLQVTKTNQMDSSL